MSEHRQGVRDAFLAWSFAWEGQTYPEPRMMGRRQADARPFLVLSQPTMMSAATTPGAHTTSDAVRNE